MNAYLGFYAPDFKPENGVARDVWARQREQRIGALGSLRIEIQSPVVRSTGPNEARSEFRQLYVTDTYGDTTGKVLEWRKTGGQWLIVRESARAIVKEQ